MYMYDVKWVHTMISRSHQLRCVLRVLLTPSMRSRCLRCFSSSGWCYAMGGFGGWGVGVGLGMLTFLELYTWLMLRNGWVWGWGGIWDVNIPSTLHMLLERTHHEDKILAALGALCKRHHCKSASKKKRKKNTWRWGLRTGMPKHNVNPTKSVESIVKITSFGYVPQGGSQKKHLFQGFTKWRQCHAKKMLWINGAGVTFKVGTSFLS